MAELGENDLAVIDLETALVLGLPEPAAATARQAISEFQ